MSLTGTTFTGLLSRSGLDRATRFWCVVAIAGGVDGDDTGHGLGEDHSHVQVGRVLERVTYGHRAVAHLDGPAVVAAVLSGVATQSRVVVSGNHPAPGLGGGGQGGGRVSPCSRSTPSPACPTATA